MDSSRRDRPERPLSDSYFADDGVDPRTYFANKDKKKGHAAGRLRRAAEQAAQLILSFELEDPVLQGLSISHITLIRNGNGVEIKVSPPEGTSRDDLELIAQKLPSVAKIVRAELAQTIQRRKALEVVIRLLPTTEEYDD